MGKECITHCLVSDNWLPFKGKLTVYLLICLATEGIKSDRNKSGGLCKLSVKCFAKGMITMNEKYGWDVGAVSYLKMIACVCVYHANCSLILTSYSPIICRFTEV